MKFTLLLLATIVVIGSVVVNLVSEDIASRLYSWFGPMYLPILYGVFVVVVFLDVWIFVKEKSRQDSAFPNDRVKDEFDAIWPDFFDVLKNDLQNSIRSAELARVYSKDRKSHPGVEVHSPSVATQFTVYHQRTVSQHDPELGGLPRMYLKASDNLRLSANVYNKFLYTDLRQGPDLGKIDRMEGRSDYRLAKDEMYVASRLLEDAIDNLRLKLRYYEDLEKDIPISVRGQSAA